MSTFSLGFTPSRIPDIDDSSNGLTIASLPGPHMYKQISELSQKEKSEFFDVLFALGVKSQNPAYGFLFEKTHPSYIRNQQDRMIHMNFSNILLAGAVSVEYICYEEKHLSDF